MDDRTLLGPADVTDDELTRMVGTLLHDDPTSVALLGSTAEVVSYDLPAITTAGRYWVSGTVRGPDGVEPFRVFVKHVQSWARSPFFAEVPEDMREMAEAGVPWRTEPLAYRSDLRDRLPDGLTMPRALGVFDLDEKSAAVWLEDVSAPGVAWDAERFARAAFLLGRLAASPRVAERAGVGEHPWSVHSYLYGRLLNQVLPMLADPGIWQHPLVAAAFDDELRGRLDKAAARATEYVDELAGMPKATAHGDASPNNLLAGPTPDSFVLIDYGFWVPAMVGFDLAQLVVGDVQIGRRPASLLDETEDACLPAYVDGLRAEGLDLSPDVVRRAHALQLLIFTGLSTLPFEHLGQPLTPELHALAIARAAIARFSLDLVESTEG
jgi:hypothetical protein